MGRLLLLRHAKSSWADAGLRDHDRPLNDRGQRAAAAMGAYLRAHELLPDLVLCSSALRTCETLARLDLPGTTAVEIERDLYLADPETVVARIRAVSPEVPTVMVVGHNPTTHDLALGLIASGGADAIGRLARKYPTGALAVLDIVSRWSDLAAESATLTDFVTPSDLEG